MSASDPATPPLDGRFPAEVASRGSAGAAAGHGRALAAFVTLFALLLLGMHDTVRDLLRLWAEDNGYYSFGYLILPICIGLAWYRRRSLAALVPRPAPLALPLILGAGAVWLLAQAADIAIAQHIALVLSMVLLVPAVYGWRITWWLTFPLAYAFLMVPFGSSLLPFLQKITTDLSDALLWLVGLPTFRDGVVIETSFSRFNVAEACAGLQFLAASVAAGLLLAHLAFSSRRRQVLFVMTLTLMPIVINAVRVSGLILVIHETRDLEIAGPDHLIYGWILFTIVMAAILLAAARAADWPMPAAAGPVMPAPAAPLRPGWFLALVPALTIAPAYAEMIMDRPVLAAASPSVPTAADLPVPNHCSVTAMPPGDWALEAEGGSVGISARVTCRSRQADLLLFGAHHGRQNNLFYHARHWVTPGPWQRAATGTVEVEARTLPSGILRHELALQDGRRRLVYAWFWMNGRPLADEADMLLDGLIARLTGETLAYSLIAVSEPARPPGDEDADDLITWFVESGLDQAVVEALEDVRPMPGSPAEGVAGE